MLSVLSGLVSFLIAMVTGFVSMIIPLLSFFLYFGLIFMMLALIVLLMAVVVVTYVLDCYTAYAIAKRAGYQYAWLAWLPYLSSFVLIQVRGDKPITLFKDEWVVEDRLRLGLLHLYFTKLMLRPLNALAKAGGGLAGPVALVGLFARGVMGHVNFLIYRDLLGMFREDEEANRSGALFLGITDAVLNIHLVRAIYLLNFLKKTEAAPEETEVVAEIAEVTV